MYRIFIVLTLILFYSCEEHTENQNLTVSPSDSFDNVRNEIKNLIKNKNITSFSIAVLKKDSLIWRETFQYEKDTQNSYNDKRAKNMTNSIYPIASLTKSMTSTLIHKLAEMGSLSLQDSISKHLNEEFNYFGRQNATIGELLSMTAGVPHGWIFINENNINSKLNQGNIYDLYNLSALPEGVYEYSNFSFGVAEKIIEKVTGMTYTAAMQEYLFEPLKMNNTYFDSEIKDSDSEYIASTKKYTFYPSAAAGAYSNLDDLIKYAKFHMGFSDEVLSKRALESMQYSKGSKDEIMALGIGNISLGDQLTWLVSNGSFSFPISSNSNLTIIPEEQIAVICLADTDFQSSADIIAIKTVDVIVPGFQKKAFTKMETYESGNNNPLPFSTDNTMNWYGIITNSEKQIPFKIQFKNDTLLYAFNDKKLVKVENYRLDNQSIIRGTINVKFTNPFSNQVEKNKATINFYVSEDKTLTGYISTTFKEENSYEVAIPYYTKLEIL